MTGESFIIDNLQKRLFNLEREDIVFKTMNQKQIIYTRMLEGTATYVPCEAIQLEKDEYQIIRNDDIDLINDATQIWEFFPGDKVKCIQKTEILFPFGGGVLIPVAIDESEDAEEKTIFLAKELIDSTFSNRKLHQLIFLIVESLGKIGRLELIDYDKEITQLCSDKDIRQRNHPVIKQWIDRNCNS